MSRLLDQVRLSAPVTVTWEVTSACNLRCRHCLSSSGTAAAGELSTSDALRLIRILAQAGVFQVNLGGGEPFLRRDTLQLMQAGVAAGMLMCVSTNGTLVDRALSGELARLGAVAVQVSVDGARRSTHEALRGAGTHAPALRAAAYLADAGVRTALNAVVTRRTIAELDELQALAAETGVELRLSRLRPSGRADKIYDGLQLDRAEFQRLGAWLAEHPDVHTGDSFFFLQENGERGGGCSALDRCGAGRFTLSLDPCGDAFPCPFLAGPGWRMGNLLHDPFARVWGALPGAREVPGEACLACLDRRCRRDCPARSIEGERIYGDAAAAGRVPRLPC